MAKVQQKVSGTSRSFQGFSFLLLNYFLRILKKITKKLYNKYMNPKLIVKRLPLLLVCLLLLNHCHKTIEKQNDDILTLLIDKPDQLEFLECIEGSGQTALEAKYRVPGMDAHIIEDLLHKEYGMSLLTFNCCGWETYPNGTIEITEEFNKKYKKRYNYEFIFISMYSMETEIKDREQWHKIPYFYVVVRVMRV